MYNIHYTLNTTNTGEVITPGDINRSFSPGEMVLADDVKPPASPDPEAIETATTAIPTPTGPPLTLETRGSHDS